MRSNNKRVDILEAALTVVEEKGANHLTIDAVAEAAGFSKGGVLYHYGSKKALLTGMLNHLIDANKNRLANESTTEKPLAVMLRQENRMTRKERRASLALVAAGSENPELLSPAKSYLRELIEEISDGASNPEEIITLFLANEGLRFLDIFEINPLTSDQVKSVTRYLSDKAKEL